MTQGAVSPPAGALPLRSQQAALAAVEAGVVAAAEGVHQGVGGFEGEGEFAGELGFNNGELGLFCIELLAPVSAGAEDYELTQFGTEGTIADRGLILASLFEQYYDDGFANRSDAAAFAMLTWEIMSETYDSDSAFSFLLSFY